MDATSPWFYFFDELAKLASYPSVGSTRASITGALIAAKPPTIGALVARPGTNVRSMANKQLGGVTKMTGAGGAVSGSIPSAAPSLTGPTPPVTIT